MVWKKKKAEDKKAKPGAEEEIDKEEFKPPKQEEESNEKWQAINMPTDYTRVIYDSENEKTYDIHSAIAELLNRTEE